MLDFGVMAVIWLFSGLIGLFIGKEKGRRVEGFFAGFLLGPIGLIWMALQKAYPKCPNCSGYVRPDSGKCKRCGAELYE